MLKLPYRIPILLIALVVPLCLQVQAFHISYEPGDVLVSLEPGPVQWRLPDGTLRAVLVPTVTGTGEGMAFDRNSNLYVTRWCIDGPCDTGNAVEMFGPTGLSFGVAGDNFNCNPHTIVFDATGAAWVGQAGCRRTLLKFVPGAPGPVEFFLAPDNYGIFWMDLARDGCTMFYTSFGPNVKRFDVCTNTQLANFNAAPLPGGMTQDVRVLDDGGVLVSSGEVIARLDSTGAVIQTYSVPTEGQLWAGIDLVGDGTFWAGNYFSSNVHKFDLNAGTKLMTFNTGTPPNTVVGVRVHKQSLP